MENKQIIQKTASWAIGLVIVCTIFTSLGQLFLKLGIKTALLNLELLTNYNLIIGLVFYAIGAILLIIAFKGGELSVLYPIIAASFIWVALLSHFYLHESISLIRWVGVAIIVLGISFIGRGSR